MGEPNGVMTSRSEDSENYDDAVQDEEEESDDEDGDDDDDSEKDDEEKSPERSRESAPRHSQQPPQQGLPLPPYPYYGYPPVAGYPPVGYPMPLTAAATRSFPYPPPILPSKGTYVDNAHAEDPKPEHRRNRGGVSKPFPEVLHDMLAALEQEGNANVASFFSHGRAFAIHKPRIFISEVMPRFFRQTKLTSFQRQLNLYGFKRISAGIDNGGYWHPLFLKGRERLCVNMKRIKVKGNRGEEMDEEPNFYAYPPIKDASGAALMPSFRTGAAPSMPEYPPPPAYGFAAAAATYRPPWPQYGYAPPPYRSPPQHGYPQPSSYSSFPSPYGWDPSAIRQMPQPSPVQPVGKDDDDTPSKGVETPSDAAVSDTPIRVMLNSADTHGGLLMNSSETPWKGSDISSVKASASVTKSYSDD